MNWIRTSERLPESGRKVLAFYRNSLEMPRIVVATMVLERAVEAGPEDDIGEYDEETETYYLPPGWYECLDNWPEYASVVIHEGTVSHWMPLPKTPQ